MAKKKESGEEVQKVAVKVEELKIARVRIPIVGKTDLLMDRFTEEALKAIEDKQTGKSNSSKKKVRNLDKEASDAIHKTSEGKVGFPVAGFKRGMMEAAVRVGDKFFSKKLVAGGIRIVNAQDGLIPVSYKKMKILKHNIGHNIKHTPKFEGWSCELMIEYDTNNIAPQDIYNLINYAGFYIGVGAWRPTCRDGGSGEYGTYAVAKAKS